MPASLDSLAPLKNSSGPGKGTGVGDPGRWILELPIVAGAGDNLQTATAEIVADMKTGTNVYFEAVRTGANGMILGNLKNAAASSLSGTQLDVEIDIGGTPYHCNVFPTKA